jgi:hypothetical protein
VMTHEREGTFVQADRVRGMRWLSLQVQRSGTARGTGEAADAG